MRMTRRSLLTNSLRAAGVLSSRLTGYAQNEVDLTSHVTIHTDRPAVPIPPDFLGLGYEISSVARQGLLHPANRVYLQLLQTLSPRGVIRVGGNTSDYASYSPAGNAVSATATIINDAVLRDLGGFLDASGWKLIWGLNLGTGSEAGAMAEANAVLASAGDRLLAFEIGNEPDLFEYAQHRKPGYQYSDWLAEYRRYKTALRESIPAIPLAGPDVAVLTDWVSEFAADEGKDTVLLTHHYYRESQNPTSTIDKLLSPDPNLQPKLDQLRAAAQSCGTPYRICEVNSFSGGGKPGVSDTLASALWVLDYMFTLAASSCSGVNMETGVNQLGFISFYSPIGDDEQGSYSAKPEYYGMLAFSRAARGEMLNLDLETSSPGLKAYATRPNPKAVLLTLINKGSAPVSVLAATGSPIQSRQASVIRLEGPALDAKSGITLGGAEVTPAGTWLPGRPERVPVRNAQVRVALRAASAAIVEIEAS
jgi:hypothetical protein